MALKGGVNYAEQIQANYETDNSRWPCDVCDLLGIVSFEVCTEVAMFIAGLKWYNICTVYASTLVRTDTHTMPIVERFKQSHQMRCSRANH